MNYALGPLKGYRMVIARIGESVNGSAHLAGVCGAQAPQHGSGQDAEHTSILFSQEAWVGV